jgi:hypothetical protein
MTPALASLFAAWSASASLHQWERPASDQEIAAAEAALNRKLPPELRALYEAGNGLCLIRGSLNLYSLAGLIHEPAAEREAGVPLPDELLLFGYNGGEELFGLWLPARADSQAAVPVIEVGEEFEPRCMAVAGTDLVRFLTARSAYYLMCWEADTRALDLLGIPMSLRSDMPDEDLLADLIRWADPELADPEPNPYERGVDADELRIRYG